MRILIVYIIFTLCLYESFSQAITVNGVGLTSASSGGSPTSCSGDYKFKNNSVPSPSITGNCITLTDGTPANGEADIWICGALDLTNDFNLTFTANFGTNPNSGDGIAFVLNGNNDAPLGGVGGNIGYESLNNIVAVEFDTWPDADISCHHAEINQNGFSNNLSSPIPLKSCCGSIIDGSDYDICITWDVLTGTTGNLIATFDGNVVGSYSGDLAVLLGNNSSPNWGFTSGCGAGGGQIQTVCDAVMENQSLTVSSCSTCTPPVVTANPITETICSGETTSLSISGSGGTSYCWQASDNLNVNGETTTITNETLSSFIIGETLTNGVPGTQTVTYNVYPESNSGCFGAPLSLVVTVLDAGDPACNCPSPYTASAPSSAPTICLSAPIVDITHSTANSSGIVNDGINGANGLPSGTSASFSGNTVNGTITIAGTPTQAGTFNYSIPFTGGCGTATATGTITVIQTPTADSPMDVTACDSYVLPSLSVGDYFLSPNGVGPISVGSSITINQTIYVYAETGTVPNCTDENSFTVTINAAPIADSPTDVTACDSYVLPSLGVGDYFSSPNGVGPISVGSSITTTQTIYVYAETGAVPNCTDENSFTVTINTTPTADSPLDLTACDSYVLPSLSVGGYFSSPNGVGPISVGSSISINQTIYVYAETGTMPNCSNENSFTVDIPTFNTGIDVQLACDSYDWIDGNTYTVSNNTAQWTLTNVAGCDSIVTLNLTINPLLSGLAIDSSFIVVSPETCASANGSITGITSSGGLSPYTYDWNGGNTSSEDTSGLAAGSYTLTVADGNGCSSSMGPIVVGSIDGPTIDATSIIITDEDCFAGNGSITGITITGGTNPYSYAWNGVVGNLDAIDLTNNDYSLVVTDDNGCTDAYGPISISNSGIPNADFDLSGNPISLGEVLLVTNNSSNGAVSYLWDLGDGTTSTNGDPSITYNAEGAYTICLIAYTATNCPDTACQTVEVIEEVESVIGIPTAFSPNNDTHNDVLYVRGSGIQSFTLVIYNRYGEKVFETNDLSSGWDGTYKGQPENTGVFAYYLEYEYVNGDKSSLKGNITLVK